jgi:hypothetical protein
MINDYTFELEEDSSVTTTNFKFTIACNGERIIRLDLHPSEVANLQAIFNEYDFDEENEESWTKKTRGQ